MHQALQLGRARIKHRAGAPQHLQDQRIRLGDAVPPRHEAAVLAQPGHPDHLLDADREAVQGPDGLPSGREVGVELGGAGEGSVREELSDAVCELGADAGAAEEGGGYGHAGEGARGEGGEEGFGWGVGDGDLGRVKEAA